MHGDYIDGGPGDDCIVLEGSGDRIVLGGSGNDKTITVPAGTSDATVQQIFAHCNDPSYLTAAMGAQAAPATHRDGPPPLTQTASVEQHAPKARAVFEVDGEIVGILCAALVALAFLSSKMVR